MGELSCTLNFVGYGLDCWAFLVLQNWLRWHLAVTNVPASEKMHKVSSFGMIRIRISDPRSLRSCCIKGTSESSL